MRVVRYRGLLCWTGQLIGVSYSALYSDSLFPALTHSAFLHPAEYISTVTRVFVLSLKRNIRQTLCQYAWCSLSSARQDEICARCFLCVLFSCSKMWVLRYCKCQPYMHTLFREGVWLERGIWQLRESESGERETSVTADFTS